MAYRRMFLMPLACMAMLATLVFYPPPPAGSIITITSEPIHLQDFGLFDVQVDKAALVDEMRGAPTDVPRDGHRLAYTIANQPMTDWRFNADAYRHIDPGRRLI